MSAVEPNHLLHDEIMLGGATEVVWAAVGSKDGEADFHVSLKDDSSSLLDFAGVEMLSEVVPTVRLDGLIDNLGLDAIDLLKIDVEGME